MDSGHIQDDTSNPIAIYSWARLDPLYVSVIVTLSLRGKYSLLTVPAIAADAVFWEEKKFPWGDRIQEKSMYSGKPSPELDKAWHDLLNGVGSDNFCFISSVCFGSDSDSICS